MNTCTGTFFQCHVAPNTPADFWAMVGAVLVLMSIVYAGSQLRFLAKTERNKQTFDLMNKYIQGERSPNMAFKILADNDPNTAFITAGDEVILNTWVVLQNYIDEVADLYNRNIINRDLFANRYHKIIAEAVSIYDKWHSDIVPSFVDDELWSSVRDELNKYRKTLKLPPVSG